MSSYALARRVDLGLHDDAEQTDGDEILDGSGDDHPRRTLVIRVEVGAEVGVETRPVAAVLGNDVLAELLRGEGRGGGGGGRGGDLGRCGKRGKGGE